jgi:hypothetical protein
MEKKYRLKKDLPDLKAEAIFKWEEDIEKFRCIYDNPREGNKSPYYMFTKEEVENNSDWFELIEPPKKYFNVGYSQLHGSAYFNSSLSNAEINSIINSHINGELFTREEVEKRLNEYINTQPKHLCGTVVMFSVNDFLSSLKGE